MRGKRSSQTMKAMSLSRGVVSAFNTWLNGVGKLPRASDRPMLASNTSTSRAVMPR